MIQHQKNTAYYLSFPMVDSATPASFKSGVSPVDTAYYKDGAGAWTSLAITDTATEIGSTGIYEIDLTAAELNHDYVIVKFAVSGAADTAFLFNLTNNSYIAENVRSEMDSNSTQLTAILADTNEMQTDLADGGRLDLILDTIDTVVDAVLVDTASTIPGLITALNDVSASDLLTTTMTESYASAGSAPSLAQIQFEIRALLAEHAASGTTLTTKKLDGSTTAATYTFDDSDNPTSLTRAT